jgi:hypothetical protein
MNHLRNLVVVGVLAALGSTTARAAAPEPARVQALVQQLDDSRCPARQHADRALRELGIGVVPQLRAALQTRPPLEVYRRIESIVNELTELPWQSDLPAALREARRSGKPIVVFSTLGQLTGEVKSVGALAMRQRTFTDLELIDYLKKNFVLVWHDQAPADLYGELRFRGSPLAFSDKQVAAYAEGNVKGGHRTLFCAADGTVLRELEGFWGATRYLAEAKSAHEQSRTLYTVARAVTVTAPSSAMKRQPGVTPNGGIPLQPAPALTNPVSRPITKFLAELDVYVRSNECVFG